MLRMRFTPLPGHRAIAAALRSWRSLLHGALVVIVALWPGAPGLARTMEASDATLLRQVAPAVVSISVWKVKPPEKPGAPPRRVKTYGSGFIVDPSGVIVTNQHVIDSALDVTVVLSDGTRTPATLVDASPMIDLAVLKVKVDHPLPSLAWGDSEALQVGDPVLTIGNGLDLGVSVSAGIVSGLNRNFGDSPFDSYIQVDAVINHGNSGGPLIGRDGKVVGVSEALINPEAMGGFIGVGLAIPTTIARFVTERLVDPHHPAPGWIGVNLQDLTPELAEPLGSPRANGAVISVVDPSGPAHAAALQPGDVLDQIDGHALDDSRAFMRAIAIHPPGDVVHLIIWRNRQKHDIAATVAAWPNYKPNGGMMIGKAALEMMQRTPDMGVKLAALDEALRKQYHLGADVSGVLIAHVEADSEAGDLGIKAGDVVTVVQGRRVTTPEDIRHAMQEAQKQHLAWIAVLVRSKTGAQWVPISIDVKRS